MRGRGELLHIEANLSNDGLGGSLIYPGNALQVGDLLGIRPQGGLNALA
jgi:hypothetical protein